MLRGLLWTGLFWQIFNSGRRLWRLLDHHRLTVRRLTRSGCDDPGKGRDMDLMIGLWSKWNLDESPQYCPSNWVVVRLG